MLNPRFVAVGSNAITDLGKAVLEGQEGLVGGGIGSAAFGIVVEGTPPCDLRSGSLRPLVALDVEYPERSRELRAFRSNEAAEVPLGHVVVASICLQQRSRLRFHRCSPPVTRCESRKDLPTTKTPTTALSTTFEALEFQPVSTYCCGWTA